MLEIDFLFATENTETIIFDHNGFDLEYPNPIFL
jgi:hypothetical protein